MTIQHDTTSPASVLAKYVGIALILLVLIWGVSKLVLRPASDRVQRADNAFARVFNLAPQTTIKADSVVLEKSSIAELAVVARKTSTLVKHETTWLGSTKILIVRGDSVAFDLRHLIRPRRSWSLPLLTQKQARSLIVKVGMGLGSQPRTTSA